MAKKRTADRVMVSILMETKFRTAGINEAKRRGLTLSGLVRNYLSNFLPENIDKSILEASHAQKVR